MTLLKCLLSNLDSFVTCVVRESVLIQPIVELHFLMEELRYMALANGDAVNVNK